MEDDSSWMLEDWNGTDRGNFGSRCRMDIWATMSGCRISLSDVWMMMRNHHEMMRNPGWMDGFLSRGSMWSSSDLLFFFCESRLCSFCRANISDVRCPASSCCITLEIVMNPKGKMFCITNVEFLMKIVKKCFFPSECRFATQHVDSRCVVLCRVLPCRPSILSDRLVLRRNLGLLSCDAPCVNLGFRLVRVCSSVQQNRVHRRVDCRFLQPSVIGDVGPYCGPSGVVAIVRVDARFQGTIVRGLGYPSCRPSPCGPRRQFDIGDCCVRSKKQLQVFGSCIYTLFQLLNNTKYIYISKRRPVDSTVPSCAVARLRHGFTVTLSEPARSVSRD